MAFEGSCWVLDPSVPRGAKAFGEKANLAGTESGDRAEGP